MEWVEEALEIALRAIDNENSNENIINQSSSSLSSLSSSLSPSRITNNEDEKEQEKEENYHEENCKNSQKILNSNESKENSSKFGEKNYDNNNDVNRTKITEPIYENVNEINKKDDNDNNLENSIKSEESSSFVEKAEMKSSKLESPIQNDVQQQQQQQQLQQQNQQSTNHKIDDESYYQVPKSSEPLYEVPKYQKPIPVYENIEIFYSESTAINNVDDYGIGGGTFPLNNSSMILEPPKEKPPPPPIDEYNSDNEDAVDGVKKNLQHHHNQQKQQKNNEEMKTPTSSPNKSINVKRMNSTKRIKKELRNKRSSFLGLEDDNNDDDIFLELTVAPPPDMAQLLQEERRLEKQLYMKAGLYESSDTGDSRDSGVSENHSRQSSEPFTNSSEEHEDLLMKKEKEIIEVLEKEEIKQRTSENWSHHHHHHQHQQQQHQQHQIQNQSQNLELIDNQDAKIQCIEDQIREQEEVLRVERELLQLEQEELKRQRENLIIRENLARRELAHGAKMLMSANHRLSLQDINNASTNHHYANLPNRIYQVEADYRKSMSDLVDLGQKRIPPAPPAKPLRSHLSVQDTSTSTMSNNNSRSINNNNNNVGLIKIANQIPPPSLSSSSSPQSRIQHSQSTTDEFVPLRNYQPASALHHGNMTRHTLHALSATPKPKYTDAWIQSTNKSNTKSSDNGKHNDSWLSYQQKRKSIPDGFNYNKHWLIQEAEQRRIDQQRGLRNGSNMNGWSNTTTATTNVNNSNSNNSNSNAIQRSGSSDNKPLPDAVIQTLTQRVQSKGLGERKRMDQPPPPPPPIAPLISPSNDSLLTTVSSVTSSMNPALSAPADCQQDKILSVSGKKKCSHCGDELGRGAAMIIESLRLFYHIQCFKCCVCHVQLGDGLNGTDVRVRNHKLHCHNCYSSDDGIKFSCV